MKIIKMPYKEYKQDLMKARIQGHEEGVYDLKNIMMEMNAGMDPEELAALVYELEVSDHVINQLFKLLKIEQDNEGNFKRAKK